MSKRFPAIPEKFQVKNGIMGMTKDVCVKLVCRSSDHKRKRSLVGVCREMYEHIKHSKTDFTPPIANDLSIQNKEDLVIGNKFVSIIRCSNCTGWTWAFVDYVLENSTYVFSINLKYVRPNIFDMGFGVIEVSRDRPFGDTRNAAKHCLYHCDGELSQNGSSYGNNCFKENDIVGLEVNTRDHTLRFFVNGRLQPVSYSGVPARVRYCVAEECACTDRYNLEDPNLECARYIHTMQENFIAGSGDRIEFVSFRRYIFQPLALRPPPADVYDPDRVGYKSRVVEWNYSQKRRR